MSTFLIKWSLTGGEQRSSSGRADVSQMKGCRLLLLFLDLVLVVVVLLVLFVIFLALVVVLVVIVLPE